MESKSKTAIDTNLGKLSSNHADIRRDTGGYDQIYMFIRNNFSILMNIKYNPVFGQYALGDLKIMMY